MAKHRDRQKFVNLAPGKYPAGESRMFSGEVYDLIEDRKFQIEDEPQSLLCIVCEHGEVPSGVEDAWRRDDGCSVTLTWQPDRWLSKPRSEAAVVFQPISATA